MSNGSNQNPGFREMNVTIPAKEMRPLHAPFNCIFIYGITGSGVTMKIGDGGQETDQNITAGRKYTLPDGRVFGRLEFYNSSGASASVNFGLALGDIDDKRVQFVGSSLAVSQAAAASSFVSNGGLDVRSNAVINANASRKSIDIRNVGSAVLFLRTSVSFGPGSDDTNGMRLNPGEVYSLLSTAAIHFRDDTSLGAGVQLYSVLECT